MLKRERGYITMAVIWVSAILVVLISGLTVYVKLQQRAVKNYEARVKAFYVAKAGASTMIFEVCRNQNKYSAIAGLDSLTKSSQNVTFGEGVYTGSVVDEKSKANMNSASEFLYRRMLEEIKVPDAAVKARGMIKWRREHGLFLHIEELGLVPELDVNDCFKVMPYFTLYSIGTPGSCSVNVNTASLEVLKTQLEEYGAPATLAPQLIQKRPFKDTKTLWDFMKKRAPRMKDNMIQYFTNSAPVHRVKVSATVNDTIKVTINTVAEMWAGGHEVIYVMDWWEE